MLKYTIRVEEKETGKELIRCDCDATFIGVAAESEAFTFHISGTREENVAIVNAVNEELSKIFEED